MLAFRPLGPADLPLLFDWLQRPHVKEWWDDGEDTLEKVSTNYGEPWDDGDVERFILMRTTDEDDGAQPVGYFQWYRFADGTAGIDGFIGEAHLLNKGIGTRALRQLLELLIERHNPPKIIIDPDPRNKRAIRCYERAGFQYYETVVHEDGTRAYMMKIDRLAPTFSQGEI